jgi:hypothetical protein
MRLLSADVTRKSECVPVRGQFSEIDLSVDSSLCGAGTISFDQRNSSTEDGTDRTLLRLRSEDHLRLFCSLWMFAAPSIWKPLAVIGVPAVGSTCALSWDNWEMLLSVFVTYPLSEDSRLGDDSSE